MKASVDSELPPIDPRGSRGAGVRGQFSSLENILLLAFIVFVQIRSFYAMFRAQFPAISAEEQFVAHGQADWRAFQNRLLGPWLEQWLAETSHVSFQTSHLVVCDCALAASNVIAFLTMRRMTGDSVRALWGTAWFAVAFVALQDGQFHYIWDVFDLLFFSCLVLLMSVNAPIWVFVVLFAAAITNRESGLFVALWLVIHGLEYRNRRLHVVRASSVMIGAALLVLGVVYTSAVRRYAWMPRADSLEVHGHPVEVLGNQVHLMTNGRSLLLAAFEDPAIALLYGFAIAFVWRRRHRIDVASGRLLALVCAMAASIFLFGIVTELRILAMILPPFGMLALSLQASGDGRLQQFERG
jgi:hypothetical protein